MDDSYFLRLSKALWDLERSIQVWHNDRVVLRDDAPSWVDRLVEDLCKEIYDKDYMLLMIAHAADALLDALDQRKTDVAEILDHVESYSEDWAHAISSQLEWLRRFRYSYRFVDDTLREDQPETLFEALSRTMLWHIVDIAKEILQRCDKELSWNPEFPWRKGVCDVSNIQNP